MKTLASFVATIAVGAVDPCHGDVEIAGSSWYVLGCPVNSTKCQSDLVHFFGYWPGCCCLSGMQWDEVTTGPSYGISECQVCAFATNNTHLVDPDPDIFPIGVLEPSWWKLLHLNSPRWYRIHVTFFAAIVLVPVILRSGIMPMLFGKVLKKARTFNCCKGWEVFCTFILFIANIQEDSPPMREGAWAIVSSIGPETQKESRPLSKRDIRRVEIQKRDAEDNSEVGNLEVGLLNPVHAPLEIELVPPDISWMRFEEYRLALGMSQSAAIKSALVRLVAFHLMQCALVTISYLGFYDLIDDPQKEFGFYLLLREWIYVASLLFGILTPSCHVFLLYQPLDDASSSSLQVALFALLPEKWMLWFIFLAKDKAHSKWRHPYYMLLWVLFAFDMCGVMALVNAVLHHTVHVPLLLTYISSTCSAAIFLVTFCSKDARDRIWKKQSKPGEHQSLIDIGRASMMRSQNKILRDVMGIGITYEQAKIAGFSAFEFKEDGITLQVVVDAGFSHKEAQTGGYSANDFKGAGISLQDLVKAGFSLKDAKSGGYIANDFKGAGVSLLDAMEAGFSLKDAKSGYSAKDFKDGGISLQDVFDAGFCGKDAKSGGYNAGDFKGAGVSLQDVVKAGFSLKDAKSGGYSAKDFKDGGISLQDVFDAGFFGKDAQSGGYNAGDFKGAGVSLQDVVKAGFSLKDAKSGGYNRAMDFKDGGISLQDVFDAGFSHEDATNGGYNAKDFKSAGVSFQDVVKAGFSLNDAKSGSYSASDFKDGGVLLQDVFDAGFSGKDAKSGGYNAGDFKGAGSIVQDLFEAGFFLQDVFGAGFSLKDAKSGGYKAKDFKGAGSIMQDLFEAGFFLQDVFDAGFSPKELKSGGCSAKVFKDAGSSVQDVFDAGFSLKEAKHGGYTAKDFAESGGSAQGLVDAGQAWLPWSETKRGGYSAKDFKGVDFSVQDVVDAGFSLKDAKSGGYRAMDFKDCGISLQDVRGAGFSLQDAKSGGYSAKDFKDCGISLQDVLGAGFSHKDAKDGGYYNAEDLADPGKAWLQRRA